MIHSNTKPLAAPKPANRSGVHPAQTTARMFDHLVTLGTDLDAFKRAERSAVITTIRTMMAVHGITPREVITWRPSCHDELTATMTRTKARPKYRDPRTGVTWAGGGRMPRWLRAEIENGRALEEFSIRHVSTPSDAQKIG